MSLSTIETLASPDSPVEVGWSLGPVVRDRVQFVFYDRDDERGAGALDLEDTLKPLDETFAHRAAAEIKAGSVWINQSSRIVPGTPFGGYKRSGTGRECDRKTLDQYRQTKTVNVALNKSEL